MNNSLEFIKNRIAEGHTDRMPVDGWEDANIINPISNYERMPEICGVVKDNEINVTMQCQEGSSEITVKYDPNIKYEYFTMRSVTHDGTLAFILDAIEEILLRPFRLATVPADSGVTQNNFFKYDYEYIIGDVIIHKDFGMKDINGHKWHGVTNTIVLPIKFSKRER